MKATTSGLVIRMLLAFAVIVVIMQAYPARAGELSYPGQNLGKIFQQADFAAQQNKHLMPAPLPHPQGKVRYHELHQQPNANLIESTKPAGE